MGRAPGAWHKPAELGSGTILGLGVCASESIRVRSLADKGRGRGLGSVEDERMRRREGCWICPFSNLNNPLDHSFREKRALGAGSREGFDGGKGNDVLAVGRKRERNK